jgi:RNA polymerase sigma-70 factor (ECF subfamily)
VNVPQVRETEIDLSQDRVDLEAIFQAQYGRIARLIAGITRDPGRAEELAVEVFLKWGATGITDAAKAGGWLNRAAVRIALSEVRRRSRSERLERFVPILRRPRTPEGIQVANDREGRVAVVLAAIKRRDAEILLLRAEGMTYEELASTLSLHQASIGTLLSRAQAAFRKEYVRRYGKTE